MKKVKERKGIFFCLLTAFISGFSIFINKFGVKGIDPFVFSGLKNLLVAFFLMSLILGVNQAKVLKKLSIRDWATLFVIGLVGGSIPFLFFFKGLTLATPAQAAFIHKNMFLLVAFLGPVLLKERLEKNFFWASLLLLTGNILLLTKTFSLSLNKGSLLIFLATFLWALENIISKSALKHLPARIVAFGRMFFGSLLIMIFLKATGRFELIADLKFGHWYWIFITSILLFAYVYTWYSGLKHLKVSVAAAILTLGAPITSLLSLIAGKSLNTNEILGIILLLAGVLIISIPRVRILSLSLRAKRGNL